MPVLVSIVVLFEHINIITVATIVALLNPSVVLYLLAVEWQSRCCQWQTGSLQVWHNHGHGHGTVEQAGPTTHSTEAASGCQSPHWQPVALAADSGVVALEDLAESPAALVLTSSGRS